MEQIALIVDHTYLYWSSIVTGLAALTAVCTFFALYLQPGQRLSGVLFVVLGVPLSLVLSRITYSYFRPEGTGLTLMGAFAGCLLTAVFLRLVRLVKNLPELLDCASLAGCLGIALGRLACVFNAADRGMVLHGGATAFWVSVVTNPVSGVTENRLATFILQTAAAGCIFLILGLHRKWGREKPGDTTLLFALLYGVSQAVLDSTRYDALHFRSNGFISVVQVLSILGIAFVAAVFWLRLRKAGGFRRWHWGLWLLQVGCTGLAGYMEYYVQRHGDQAAFAYGVMTAALAVLAGSVLLTRFLAGRNREVAIWKQ